jgi:hypothetical protein
VSVQILKVTVNGAPDDTRVILAELRGERFAAVRGRGVRFIAGPIIFSSAAAAARSAVVLREKYLMNIRQRVI